MQVLSFDTVESVQIWLIENPKIDIKFILIKDSAILIFYIP